MVEIYNEQVQDLQCPSRPVDSASFVRLLFGEGFRFR